MGLVYFVLAFVGMVISFFAGISSVRVFWAILEDIRGKDNISMRRAFAVLVVFVPITFGGVLLTAWATTSILV